MDIQRERPFTDSLPNACNDGSGPRPKPGVRNAHGRQELSVLSHDCCFPESALVGSWSQELELGVGPQQRHWETPDPLPSFVSLKNPHKTLILILQAVYHSAIFF